MSVQICVKQFGHVSALGYAEQLDIPVLWCMKVIYNTGIYVNVGEAVM